MQSPNQLANEGASDAFVADEARRASAARAIAAVFGVLTFLGAAPPLIMGKGQSAALVQLAASFALFVIWWRARGPHSATRTGLGVVLVVMLQVTVSALQVARSEDAALISSLIALMPLVAAVTLGPRGVLLTGVGGTLALGLTMALRWSEESRPSFVTGGFYLAAAWAAAMFGSIASLRALRAHVAEARRVQSAEAAARRAQRQYQLVSELVSDLVVKLDNEGRVIYASPSFQRILGVDPESILGRSTPELLHPEDLGAAGSAFMIALEHGKATAATRVRAASGSYRWFHMSMSRIEESEEESGIIALSARDISEQRELSEALEATRRMEALGRLAGGVAHDFNNLLMVIQSASDLVATQLPKDHLAHAELDEVTHATQRAAALTQQLLTFARRQVLAGDSSSVVLQVVKDLCPILIRLCGPQIEFTAELGNSRRRVDVSAVQLEQMLMNLCANARDAMPNGGRLRVELRERTVIDGETNGPKEGEYVELVVEDTGTGISPEVQARMFEPFFTTKTEGRGTGLGLATVFGLVSQLGGHVRVRSELGRGSTFTILLPVANETAARSNEVNAAPVVDDPSMHVLVVEDEPAVRMLIARILSKAGHRVTEADSYEQALAAAEAPEAKFQAIVTDVVLGAGDGIALLERIRSRHPRASVVVVSGFSPSPDRVAELSARGAEFLPKPFGAAALLEALASARRLHD